MNNSKQSQSVHEGTDRGTNQQGHRPYWRRAHEDWHLMIAVLLMIAAMLYYVMTDDFAMRFRGRPQPMPLAPLVK
jgi:hypothetical protein